MILAALCLASNIYFEARGEPIDGQILVAEVTLNRGGDICATVFEHKQFSWTIEKNLAIDEPEAFYQAYVLASDMIDNGCIMCSDATYYHTKSVKPYWAKHLTKLGSYGNHVFYKE
jgi:spore germination cell wall hydrolase CwlJ-like protein